MPPVITETPKSEVPPSNVAAVSTPAEIDFEAVVLQCAKRKTSVGTSFQGKKGKNHLFALCCSAVKSLRGMARTAHVSSEDEKAIQDAIAAFWLAKSRDILSYGTVVSASFDKPTVKFNAEGEAQLTLNAKLHATRSAKDNAEARLHLSFCLKTARKRLDYMLDNPAEFERDETREQMDKITAIENAVAAAK